MKATKKIVGAACALVAAVALSAGSTFAWFASNTQVSAGGMSVQATSSKNLLISTSSTGTWDVTASYQAATMTLGPCSTTDTKIKEGKFFETTAAGINATSGVAGVGTVFSEATGQDITTNPTEASVDFVCYSYYVKVDGSQEFSKIYVDSITVTRGGNESNISKAIRVGVVSATTESESEVTKAYIYAPVSGGSNAYGVVAAGTVDSLDSSNNAILKDNAGTALTATTTTTAVNTATATLGNVTSTAKHVKIYVWYEGQDAACTTANSAIQENLNISVSFTAAN